MNPNDLSVSNNRPFFVPGGTLPGDAPSYVTRQADYNLLEGLRGGQFCYVLTARQMGKSSLMVRVANQMREEGGAVAVLDLTALGQNVTVEQWYFGLLEQLGRHLKLEEALDDYWHSHKSLGPMQRWMAAIRDVLLRNGDGQVTVFVDEIDIVRSLPFSTDEFFAAIRECYNRRAQEPEYARLTFCLLGVATPSGLIRDTSMTPFNIGRRIELTDFTPQEAETLSVGISVTGRDGHGLLRRILYWTGGQPYLTQRLCNSVAEDAAALRDEDVDRLCGGLFLTPKARESNDNLQFVRNRLLRSEVDLTALLSRYSQILQNARVADDEANVLTSVLKLSGITRVERGELKVRNRIYARVFDRAWVQTHLPGAELRRQRTAYRLGVVRALALSSLVLLALGGLTLFGFSQARRANQEAMRAHQAVREAQTQADAAERLSYIARMNLVQRDWEIDDISGAADLLESTRKSKFRGFEWGYWNRRLHLEQFSLKGHLSYVKAVAYSPDGKRIVTGSVDNIARIWDATTGQERLTLKGNIDGIYAVAFSPDGKRIITGCGDNIARVWDASTGKEISTLKGHTGIINSVAFSPDGTRILTGSGDKTARIWDSGTGTERLTLKGHKDQIFSVAFSPDGKQIVTGSQDRTTRLWDAVTGKEQLTLKGFTSSTSVAFSPDGKRIVTGSEDYTASLWDATTGARTLTLTGHTSFVTSVVFSPDGKRIVTGSEDKTARVWDALTGQNILTFKGHTGAVTSVAFSLDNRHLTTGSEDNTARVWDVAIRETLTLKERTDGIGTVAYSLDGKWIITGCGDNNVRVWDATTGKERRTLKGHTGAVIAIAFSPDGKRIVTGSWDNTAKVWDAVTGQETLTLKGHTNCVTSVAFSPDGKHIATGSMDSTVRLWDSTTGQQTLTLQGQEHATGDLIIDNRQAIASCAVAFSPDSKHIAAIATWDFKVRVWDSTTGKETLTLKEDGRDNDSTVASSVVFSPDGKQIATCSGHKTARVWDATTGKETLTLKGHTSFVNSVAFSSDGKRIVTGSWDNTAKVWDAVTGQETLTLKGHTGFLGSVAFSPDGKRILTGSQDRTARVWYSE